MSIKRKQKFTLIEVLVVVAIIGILASFLMPALSKARKKSRISVCLNNQKQLATSLAMYIGDNDFRAPSSTGGNGVSWDDRLGGGYDGRALTLQKMTNNNVKSHALYECPLDARVRSSGRPTRSYSMNQKGRANSGSARGIVGTNSRRITEINQTSDTLLLMDYSSGSNQLGRINRATRQPSHLKNPDGNDEEFWTHGWGMANYMMVDGSARGLGFMQTFLGLRNPWENRNPANTMWDSYR